MTPAIPSVNPLPKLDTTDICPLIHQFSDGVYLREIFMPAGTYIIGHKHKTNHFNIVSQGSALVWMNGEIEYIQAPSSFESKAGTRKILLILEDMRWSTVHHTDVKDHTEAKSLLIEDIPVPYDLVGEVTQKLELARTDPTLITGTQADRYRELMIKTYPAVIESRNLMYESDGFLALDNKKEQIETNKRTTNNS